MNPKHVNPTEYRTDKKNRFQYWASAPYNFVPLPEKVVTVDNVPRQDIYTNYTGTIHCTLTTKTPLYVRAMMTQKNYAMYGQTGIGDLMDEIERMKRNPPSAERDTHIKELERTINERAQFFAVQNIAYPVIPGSSLRGMIRSLVEISSYSKIQPVTNSPLIFRAVGDTSKLGAFYRDQLMRDDGENHFTPKMQAGYLYKHGNRWEIKPAQMIDGVTFARIHHDVLRALVREPDQVERSKEQEAEELAQAVAQLQLVPHCKNARRIWIKLGKYDYQPVRDGVYQIKYTPVTEARAKKTAGYQEACLALSGPMNKKQREAVIFPEQESAEPIVVDDVLVQAYRDQISPEQEKLLGASGVLQNGQPVFYLLENDRLVFFGHVMLFRLPYHASPKQFVPSQLQPENQTDLAEAIFGFVLREEKDKRQAHAGRVFFSDATTTARGDAVWLTPSPITPKILAAPKPTTFQHYLTQQEPDAVDTGRRTKDGRPVTELKLDHYASPPPHETIIRGHKLYWHRGEIGLSDIAESDTRNIREHPKQYTRIQPVKDNVSFEFDIHFENLTPVELGALLWVLRLPPNHLHKLGMGKPLGMGAVEIVPTVHLYNRKSRYKTLCGTGGWHVGDVQTTDEKSWRAAFEDFVLERMDQTERGQAQRLADLERIQMMLKMLEWKGPDSQITRYMKIKPNEFKERSVLPDPLHLTIEQARADQPVPTRLRGRPSQARPAQQSEPMPVNVSAPPRDAPKNYVAGDTFTGKIHQKYSDGSLKILVPSWVMAEGYAYIPVADLGRKPYTENAQIRCQVIRVTNDKTGVRLLVCKPDPKQTNNPK